MPQQAAHECDAGHARCMHDGEQPHDGDLKDANRLLMTSINNRSAQLIR